MNIDTEALKERIYALEADLDTAQHADHEETIRALVVAADRLAALEAELASMRTDRDGAAEACRMLQEDKARLEQDNARLREALAMGTNEHKQEV